MMGTIRRYWIKYPVFMLVLLLSVAMNSWTHLTFADEFTEDVIGIPSIWENSVLYYGENEDASHLMEDMIAKRIPTSCQVLYDLRGTRPEITVTDPQTIIKIYNRLAKVYIRKEQDKTVEGGDHHVIFTLQDGSSVSFEFQGDNLYRWDGSNYQAYGGEKLWKLIFDMQEESVEYDENGPYPILVEAGSDTLTDCPREAMAGDTVRIETVFVEDGEVYILVNNENMGSFIKGNVYEFVMPQGPARIEAGISTAGYAGS